MQYVFMDNFRGFANSLIPIEQVNFLVGENSTGKSSFLSVIKLILNSGFWMYPDHYLQEEMNFSSYADMVSAGSSDKSNFSIGVMLLKKDKDGLFELSFAINKFGQKDGAAKLIEHIQLKSGFFYSISLESRKVKYYLEETNSFCKNKPVALSQFLKLKDSSYVTSENYKLLPKEIPTDAPIPIIISLISSIAREFQQKTEKRRTEVPMSADVTWISPIRSKPKKIYDGGYSPYSPDGDHTPLVIRKTLKSKVKGIKFQDSLQKFGSASGLFDSVACHSFGKGSQAPFEILVKFKDVEVNINNVGYGVSQVLPLIVEFLVKDEGEHFCVQQPEVHLHPKAQAAFGQLIFDVASQLSHSFFIETHSDYLIDRYRISMRSSKTKPSSQLIFFERTPTGNTSHILSISEKGLYPENQPRAFRDFFIKEEMMLLDL